MIIHLFTPDDNILQDKDYECVNDTFQLQSNKYAIITRELTWQTQLLNLSTFFFSSKLYLTYTGYWLEILEMLVV